MTWIRAVLRAVWHFPGSIRFELEQMRWERHAREQIAWLERESARIVDGPVGRLYEMPDGRCMTYLGGTFGAVVPVSRADAEDLYGWTPA